MTLSLSLTVKCGRVCGDCNVTVRNLTSVADVYVIYYLSSTATHSLTTTNPPRTDAIQTCAVHISIPRLNPSSHHLNYLTYLGL